MSESEQRTPELVRKYRDLHITGARRRLFEVEASELRRVVDELGSRNVLD
jgi:hypothetical protein